MKKIDKMVKQAKQLRKKTINRVHIIEEGYCSSCKGKCRYEDNPKEQIEDEVVIIYDDIPGDEEVVVINIDIPRGGGVDESEKEG